MCGVQEGEGTLHLKGWAKMPGGAALARSLVDVGRLRVCLDVAFTCAASTTPTYVSDVNGSLCPLDLYHPAEFSVVYDGVSASGVSGAPVAT